MDDRLVELLGLYGLSEREARVYLFLTRNGSTGAGEVAKAVDIRRMEAYRLLKRLLERGVVSSTAGKPIKYQAEGLEGVLSTLTDEQRGQVRRMDDAQREAIDLWRQLPRAPKENFEQRFRIIQGREQIYATISKMLDAATKSVAMTLTRNDVVQAYVLGLADKVSALRKLGVKSDVITVVDPSTIEAAEAFSKSADVKHSEEDARSRLVLVDGSQSLVSLVLDDSKGMKNERDVAIWTDSKDYGELMSGLYSISFERGEAGADRIAQMKGRLRFEEKVSTVVGAVRSALAERGWTVDAPGRMTGASGNEFEFMAVLEGPQGQNIGVEVVFGTKDKPVGELVTASVVKKLDLDEAGMLILASPMPDEQTTNLAKLLGVQVVDASDPVDAAVAVRDQVTKAG